MLHTDSQKPRKADQGAWRTYCDSGSLSVTGPLKAQHVLLSMIVFGSVNAARAALPYSKRKCTAGPKVSYRAGNSLGIKMRALSTSIGS